jgi:hypothetical protein
VRATIDDRGNGALSFISTVAGCVILSDVGLAGNRTLAVAVAMVGAAAHQEVLLSSSIFIKTEYSAG